MTNLHKYSRLQSRSTSNGNGTSVGDVKNVELFVLETIFLMMEHVNKT